MSYSYTFNLGHTFKKSLDACISDLKNATSKYREIHINNLNQTTYFYLLLKYSSLFNFDISLRDVINGNNFHGILASVFKFFHKTLFLNASSVNNLSELFSGGYVIYINQPLVSILRNFFNIKAQIVQSSITTTNSNKSDKNLNIIGSSVIHSIKATVNLYTVNLSFASSSMFDDTQRSSPLEKR